MDIMETLAGLDQNFDIGEIRELYLKKLEPAQIILHPDTDNTFAAYQIISADGATETWMNARNGSILTIRPLIHRYYNRRV